MGLVLRMVLTGMLRMISPPGLRRVPVPRLLGLLLLGWRRPTRRTPAGRSAVIGLPGTTRTVLRVMTPGGMRTIAIATAIAVGVGALLGMRGAGRGDRLLERRFRHRLRPRLAAFDSELARCFDRWFV